MVDIAFSFLFFLFSCSFHSFFGFHYFFPRPLVQRSAADSESLLKASLPQLLLAHLLLSFAERGSCSEIARG